MPRPSSESPSNSLGQTVDTFFVQRFLCFSQRGWERGRVWCARFFCSFKPYRMNFDDRRFRVNSAYARAMTVRLICIIKIDLEARHLTPIEADAFQVTSELAITLSLVNINILALLFYGIQTHYCSTPHSLSSPFNQLLSLQTVSRRSFRSHFKSHPSVILCYDKRFYEEKRRHRRRWAQRCQHC